MKRIILIICCVLLFMSGCNSKPVETEKQEVKINLPSDDTLNGYRLDGYISPDSVPQNEVGISGSDDKNVSYCGNKNSKIFHKLSCGSIKNMNDSNKVYFPEKNEFIENGYKPCKNCNP